MQTHTQTKIRLLYTFYSINTKNSHKDEKEWQKFQSVWKLRTETLKTAIHYYLSARY